MYVHVHVAVSEDNDRLMTWANPRINEANDRGLPTAINEATTTINEANDRGSPKVINEANNRG